MLPDRSTAVSILVVLAVLVVSPSAALAHSDLDYTLPTDGAAVGEPVSEITVAFTEPVTLVGVGFEVLDPQGNLIVPFAVTDDNMVFRLQLDPAIGGGAVGVRYEVTSADGHVIDGSFSFVVDAPAPTTTLPVSTTTASTSVPAVSTPATSATSVAPTTAAGSSTTVAPVVATTVAPAATTSTIDDAVVDDESSSTTLYLMLVGAGVAALIAFVIVRSRR